ncbi:hypothetical protein P171DRAFT_289996 [Karstenula rhodostoma CBS 690.94]|uniref:Uncharacterized protein n=1 Tax=Karstenula rhodostoma CBS 690.94 TaxID=1392251 RepID=A0A9P4PHG0_9PLEO|nr:hypothetical protein P171DRAFT_289996 [Karstenula rhodostoma CBS 690.94]
MVPIHVGWEALASKWTVVRGGPEDQTSSPAHRRTHCTLYTVHCTPFTVHCRAVMLPALRIMSGSCPCGEMGAGRAGPMATGAVRCGGLSSRARKRMQHLAPSLQRPPSSSLFAATISMRPDHHHDQPLPACISHMAARPSTGPSAARAPTHTRSGRPSPVDALSRPSPYLRQTP